MSTNQTSPDQISAVRDAFASVRSSLKCAPAFMAAVAIAAGMSSTDAQAWGNDFERLGRVIGGEVGRNAGDGASQARVGGLIGEVLGSRAGRPADAADKEAQRIADIQRQAREQAVRDTAYDAERRRIDPNYQRQSGASNSANRGYTTMGSNLQLLSQRQNALAAEYAARNHPRQR